MEISFTVVLKLIMPNYTLTQGLIKISLKKENLNEKYTSLNSVVRPPCHHAFKFCYFFFS